MGSLVGILLYLQLYLYSLIILILQGLETKYSYSKIISKFICEPDIIINNTFAIIYFETNRTTLNING